jgi:hypothetical protein
MQHDTMMYGQEVGQAPATDRLVSLDAVEKAINDLLNHSDGEDWKLNTFAKEVRAHLIDAARV